MNKRILFLCGSPRGAKSASRITAEYLSRFLDSDFEFVDVGRAHLTNDPTVAEPAFVEIAQKMKNADAIVWVFGAWIWFMPLDLQYLLDKLFTLEGYDFEGKLAASVMTSVRVKDDYILERARFVSEQLGMRYIGDVSAVGNPMAGYADDEQTTEESCRILAAQLDRALADGFHPARKYTLVERRHLSSAWRGEELRFDPPLVEKTGDKTIVVLTGLALANHPPAATIIEGIRRSSRNRVEVIELASQKVGRCIGCYLCDFKVEGVCVVKDDYEAIKARLHQADGIVLLGTCSCGMVDSLLKAYLDRSWGVAHRPTLKGRYGLTVATGGGPLEADAADYLRDVATSWGVRCIGTLNPSADPDGFAATLRRAVEDLDRAMDERWRIADRFTANAIDREFRDLAATAGMMLRADYRYRKETRQLGAPSPGGVNAVLRLAFRSKRLEDMILAANLKQICRNREARLAAYVAAGGKVGSGRPIQ